MVWEIRFEKYSLLKVGRWGLEDLSYIGWCKKMAQLLVGHNFKFAAQEFTKIHSKVLPYVFSQIMNFQHKWTTNVEMAIAWKLCVQISIIVDTSNIECVQHALCMAYCCDKLVPSLSMVPNFHNHHCKYILNRCNYTPK